MRFSTTKFSRRAKRGHGAVTMTRRKKDRKNNIFSIGELENFICKASSPIVNLPSFQPVVLLELTSIEKLESAMYSNSCVSSRKTNPNLTKILNDWSIRVKGENESCDDEDKESRIKYVPKRVEFDVFQGANYLSKKILSKPLVDLNSFDAMDIESRYSEDFTIGDDKKKKPKENIQEEEIQCSKNNSKRKFLIKENPDFLSYDSDSDAKSDISEKTKYINEMKKVMSGKKCNSSKNKSSSKSEMSAREVQEIVPINKKKHVVGLTGKIEEQPKNRKNWNEMFEEKDDDKQSSGDESEATDYDALVNVSLKILKDMQECESDSGDTEDGALLSSHGSSKTCLSSAAGKSDDSLNWKQKQTINYEALEFLKQCVKEDRPALKRSGRHDRFRETVKKADVNAERKSPGKNKTTEKKKIEPPAINYRALDLLKKTVLQSSDSDSASDEECHSSADLDPHHQALLLFKESWIPSEEAPDTEVADKFLSKSIEPEIDTKSRNNKNGYSSNSPNNTNNADGGRPSTTPKWKSKRRKKGAQRRGGQKKSPQGSRAQQKQKQKQKQKMKEVLEKPKIIPYEPSEDAIEEEARVKIDHRPRLLRKRPNILSKSSQDARAQVERERRGKAVASHDTLYNLLRGAEEGVTATAVDMSVASNCIAHEHLSGNVREDYEVSIADIHVFRTDIDYVNDSGSGAPDIEVVEISDSDTEGEIDIVRYDPKSEVPLAFTDHTYSKWDSSNLDTGEQLDHDYSIFTHRNLPACYSKRKVVWSGNFTRSVPLRSCRKPKPRKPSPEPAPRPKRVISPKKKRFCNSKQVGQLLSQYSKSKIRNSRRIKTKKDMTEAVHRFMRQDMKEGPDFLLVKVQDHNDKERERRLALRHLFDYLCEQMQLPTGSSRPSKLMILKRARQFIQLLNYDSQVLKAEGNELKAQQRILMRRLQNLCNEIVDERVRQNTRKRLKIFGIK